MSLDELAEHIYTNLEEHGFDKNKKQYRINDIKQIIEWSRVRREPIILNHVYVVTTLRFGYKYGNRKRSGDGRFHSFYKRTSKTQRKYFTTVSERTWGWYKSLEEAQKCVEENWCDIYEGEYTHAVIERISEGVLHAADTPDEWWYKWHGTWEKGRYKKWKKPEQYSNIICLMNRMRPLRAHWADIIED